MQNAGPILDYDTRLPWPPRTLRLEERDGHVRVTFAVAPTWIYILSIVLTATIGLGNVALVIWFIGTIWKVAQALHVPIRNFQFAYGGRLIPALFWIAIAAHQGWMYHRWGRVPRVLTATGEGLVLSRLGWWRLRERKWLLNEITGVQFCPINVNLNPWRTAADLYINHRKGLRRLHFRLSSPDPHLPGQIAERVAAVLGFPLK